jgi:prophage DNA circulation protein
VIDLSQYRQASFRGIPFHVASSSLRITHRIDKKSYPLGKRGLVTDMGTDDDVFQESIFLLGDDVLQRRRDLENAFRTIGQGQYVHPTRGTLEVVVESANCEESMTELGVADFTVTFVLAGKIIGPTARLDTQANVLTAARLAEESVTDGYDFDIQDASDTSQIDYQKLTKAAFDLYRMSQTITPGAIKGAAIDLATTFALETVVQAGPSLVSEAFSMASEIGDYFGATPEGVKAFTGVLTEGAGQAWNLVSESGVLQGTAMSPVLSTLSNRFMATNVVATSSEATNTKQVGQAIFDAMTITASKAVANTPFESVQEALGVRDTLVSALSFAASATTTSDPERATARNQSLRNLRTAVSRDVSENITGLPWLETETPATSTPARVMSYRLTGNINDGLTTRNTVLHPSFVEAGKELLYLVKENRNG